MIIIIIQGVPWLENDKMSLDTNWWVRCWATRRNEMCTTDLARRGLKPTMGVEEEEVINVFVILILILILIVGMLSILHYIIILIRRVTQWLHVPRGPDKNVPTIFRDFEPLRELLQHAWHGLQSTPGDLSFLRLQYFLHSYLFYFFFASLYILTSLYDYKYLFLARVSSTMATLMGWIRMILSQGGFLLILPFGNCVYGHFHLLSGVRIDQIYVRS